jgi:nicotinamidase-related amidase
MTDHDRVLKVLRIKDQAPITLDAQKTALLIIDAQRYFVSPDYAFAQVFEKLVPGSTAEYFNRVNARVLPNIKRLQNHFRSRNLPVIYTATGSCMPEGRDLPQWLKDFDQLGLALLNKRVWPQVSDPSWQIDDAVAPLPGEMVINKTSSGPLNSTKLDQTLHNLGVNSLIVTGLTTDVCVTQTAREMADRGFQVLIAEDACTTLSDEMHKGALQCFSIAFGRVRSTEAVMKLLSTASAA